MTNGATDSFMEVYRALDDEATAAAILNLHKRLAAIEADRKVGLYVFAAMRWLLAGGSSVAIIKLILDTVAK